MKATDNVNWTCQNIATLVLLYASIVFSSCSRNATSRQTNKFFLYCHPSMALFGDKRKYFFLLFLNRDWWPDSGLRRVTVHNNKSSHDQIQISDFHPGFCIMNQIRSTYKGNKDSVGLDYPGYLCLIKRKHADKRKSWFKCRTPLPTTIPSMLNIFKGNSF